MEGPKLSVTPRQSTNKHLQPRPGSDADFIALVRELNATYGLTIPIPDSGVSPQKYKEGLTDLEKLGARVSGLLRYFAFNVPQELLDIKEQFFLEAKKLSSLWVAKPRGHPDLLPVTTSDPPRATNAEEEWDLQECLLNILRAFRESQANSPGRQGAGGAGGAGADHIRKSPCPGRNGPPEDAEGDLQTPASRQRNRKRHPGEANLAQFFEVDDEARASAKRAKQALDEVPVRNRNQHPTSTVSAVATASFRGARQLDAYSVVTNQTSFSTVRTAGTSFRSTVFSVPGNRSDYPPSTQTTVASDSQEWKDVVLPDVIPLDKAFHAPEAPGGQSYVPVPMVDDNNSPPGRVASSSPSPPERSKFQDLWPKLPDFLADAPLPVAWEITRAALHCQVDLNNLVMRYDESWHDQSNLINALRTHHDFKYNETETPLPVRSDRRAWMSAFTTFQHNGRAVSLVMEATASTRSRGRGIPSYDLTLQPLKFEDAHRLGRRFGHDRFLEVIFPSLTDSAKEDAAASKDFIRWLATSEHNFLGRTWRAFFTKSWTKKDTQKNGYLGTSVKTVRGERVYFFAVDGSRFRSAPMSLQPELTLPPKDQALAVYDRTKVPLVAFLEWAVSISRNTDQKTQKLFSRLALSLTRTTSTVVLDKNAIIDMDRDLLGDVIEIVNGKERREAMNDGIGQMSLGLARKITECLGLDIVPSGFQGRLGSAKGVWIVDAAPGSGQTIWITTYPSQRKWECDYDDPDHRTFEVKEAVRELCPATLNCQFIPVLEDRAINKDQMRRTISDFLVQTVTDDLEAQSLAAQDPIFLLRWADRNASFRKDRILHGQVDQLAGLPKSDEEVLKFLVCAGFDPKTTPYLQELVSDLFTKSCKMVLSKLKVKIPRSTYAFMVVDFSGVLKEGEVHFGFSSAFDCDESPVMLHDIEALVARAPAHFPSDIQKVRVVCRPELLHLRNVIVFSSKGKIPLASLLSGGDYDGDKAWVCWDPDVVHNFENAPVPPQPDLFEKGYLRKDPEGFNDILVRCKGSMDRAASQFIHHGIRANMQQSLLGQCTIYKEKLCYRNNTISDRSAVLLSTLVGLLVDQAKQGFLFTVEDWRRLKKECIPRSSHVEDPQYHQDSFPKEREPVHILDCLKFSVAKPTIDRAVESLKQAMSAGGKAELWDPDLAWYYNEVDELATNSNTYKALRIALEKDLHAVRDLWTSKVPKSGHDYDYPTRVKEVYQAWLDIRPKPECLEQSCVRTLLFSTKSQDIPDTHSYWGKLKASTTFRHFYRARTAFVWRMAGHQLAAIKAERRTEGGEQGPVPIVPSIYAVHRPDKRIAKALLAEDKAAGYSESLAAGLEDPDNADRWFLTDGE